LTEDMKYRVEAICRVSGVDPKKCMKCGKCSGACPSYHEMEYHPHQFVSLVERGRLDELMASESLWKCVSCFACTERCPRNVEPARIIEAVRLARIRKQGENHLNASDVPALLDPDMPQQAITSAFRKYSK